MPKEEKSGTGGGRKNRKKLFRRRARGQAHQTASTPLDLQPPINDPSKPSASDTASTHPRSTSQSRGSTSFICDTLIGKSSKFSTASTGGGGSKISRVDTGENVMANVFSSHAGEVTMENVGIGDRAQVDLSAGTKAFQMLKERRQEERFTSEQISAGESKTKTTRQQTRRCSDSVSTPEDDSSPDQDPSESSSEDESPPSPLLNDSPPPGNIQRTRPSAASHLNKVGLAKGAKLITKTNTKTVRARSIYFQEFYGSTPAHYRGQSRATGFRSISPEITHDPMSLLEEAPVGSRKAPQRNRHTDNLKTAGREVEGKFKKPMSLIDEGEGKLKEEQKGRRGEDSTRRSPSNLPFVGELSFLVGEDNFASVAEQKRIIIDKTLLVKEVLNAPAQVSLIIRPRRFGKTFNLRMLECFFDQSTKKETVAVFNNNPSNNKPFQIWTEKGGKYQKQHGAYPVIFLTFKDIKEGRFEDAFNGFKRLIGKLCETYCKKYGVEITPQIQKIISRTADKMDLQFSLKDLTECLYQSCQGKKVILLIDEYDTPIHAAYTHAKERGELEKPDNDYKQLINFMRALLAPVLKGNEFLYRGVLTGILRVSKESIFSGMNNIKVYSVLDDKFSEYFGFTSQEVEDQLKQTFSEIGIQRLPEIKSWYGGHRIGNQTMLNPWSVTSFIEDHRERGLGGEIRFNNYWINTSGNELTVELLKHLDETDKQDFLQFLHNQPVVKKIDEHTVFGDIGKNPDVLWSLLLLSGYLSTYQNPALTTQSSTYSLVIPNNEIYEFYQTQFKDWPELKQEKALGFHLQDQKSTEDHRIEDDIKRLKDTSLPIKEKLLVAHRLINKQLINLDLIKVLLEGTLVDSDNEKNLSKALLKQDLVSSWMKERLPLEENILQIQQIGMGVLNRFGGDDYEIIEVVSHFLLKDKDESLRLQTVQALGEKDQGNENIVNELKVLLEKDTPKIQIEVIRVLEKWMGNGNEAVKMALLPGLKSIDPIVRLQTVSILGRGYDSRPDILSALLPLLGKDTPEIQQALIVFLGKLAGNGNKVAESALLPCLRSNDPVMSLQTVKSLGDADGYAVSTELVSALLPLWEREMPEIQQAVMIILGKWSRHSNEAAQDALVSRLQSAKPEVRLGIINALSGEHNGSLKLLSVLLPLLKEDTPEICQAVIQALKKWAENGNEEAKKALLPLLKSENVAVRLEIINALGGGHGYKGNFEIVRALEPLIKLDILEIQEAVIAVLGKWIKGGNEEAQKVLLQCLRLKDIILCLKTIIALRDGDDVYAGNSELVSGLERLLNQGTREIQQIVMTVLEKWAGNGNEAAKRVLFPKLRSNNALVRLQTVKRLGGGNDYKGSPEVISAVESSLKWDIPEIQEVVVSVLAKWARNANKNAINALLTALQSTDIRVRMQTVNALGEVDDYRGNPDLISVLERLLKQEVSEVQVVIVAVLEKWAFNGNEAARMALLPILQFKGTAQLLQIVKSLSGKDNYEGNSDIVSALVSLRERENSEIQEAVMAVLQKWAFNGNEAAQKVLLPNLESKDTTQVLKTVKSLGGKDDYEGNSDLISVLLPLREREDSEIQEVVMTVLKKWAFNGNEAAQKVLLPNLHSKEASVCLETVQMLGGRHSYKGTLELISILEVSLKQDAPEIQKAVIATFDKWMRNGNEAANKALLLGLQSDYTAVRLQTIRALCASYDYKGSPELISVLEITLKQDISEIQQAVISVFEKWAQNGNELAKKLLLPNLQSKDASVRLKTVIALGGGDRYEVNPELMPNLLPLWEKDSIEIQKILILIFEKWAGNGNEVAKKLLLPRLQLSDPTVQLQTVNALGGGDHYAGNLEFVSALQLLLGKGISEIQQAMVEVFQQEIRNIDLSLVSVLQPLFRKMTSELQQNSDTDFLRIVRNAGNNLGFLFVPLMLWEKIKKLTSDLEIACSSWGKIEKSVIVVLAKWGVNGNEAAKKVLLPWLHSPDPIVRLKIVTALSGGDHYAGNAEFVSALQSLVGRYISTVFEFMVTVSQKAERNTDARPGLLSVLLMLWEEAQQPTSPLKIASSLGEEIEQSVVTVFEKWARNGNEAAKKALLLWLNSDDPETHLCRVGALGGGDDYAGTSELVSALQPLLESGSFRLQRDLMMTLQKWGRNNNEAAQEALALRCIQLSDPAVRLKAVKELGDINDGSIELVFFLKKFLKHDTPEIQQAVMSVLEKWAVNGNEAAQRALLPQSQSENTGTQPSADIKLTQSDSFIEEPKKAFQAQRTVDPSQITDSNLQDGEPKRSYFYGDRKPSTLPSIPGATGGCASSSSFFSSPSSSSTPSQNTHPTPPPPQTHSSFPSLKSDLEILGITMSDETAIHDIEIFSTLEAYENKWIEALSRAELQPDRIHTEAYERLRQINQFKFLPPFRNVREEAEKTIMERNEQIAQEAQEREKQLTQRTAAKYALTLQEVSDKGNCFFDSVSDQLQQRYQVSISADSLRWIAMEQMRHHPDRYADKLVAGEDFNFKDVEQNTLNRIIGFIDLAEAKKILLTAARVNKINIIGEVSKWSIDQLLSHCAQHTNRATISVLSEVVLPLLTPAEKVTAHVNVMLKNVGIGEFKKESKEERVTDYRTYADDIDILAMSDALGISIISVKPARSAVNVSSSSSSSSFSSSSSNSSSLNSNTATTLETAVRYYNQNNTSAPLTVIYNGKNHYQSLRGNSAQILDEAMTIGGEAGLALPTFKADQLKKLADSSLSALSKTFGELRLSKKVDNNSEPSTTPLSSFFPQDANKQKKTADNTTLHNSQSAAEYNSSGPS